MGRDSGYIAANAALAMSDVNYLLIPEVDFELYGEKGFLRVLKKRLIAKQHAVVVVAEGAGQKYFQTEGKIEKDASGNIKFKDIGLFLKNEISEFFKKEEMEVSMKYIDPSYLIRSVPANAPDSVYCLQLGHNAVHAAMSGKTNMIVSHWNGQFTHVPIKASVSKRKTIDLNSSLWRNVLEVTGYPPFYIK